MLDLSLGALFTLVCHQWPDRSPQFEGYTFPCCYRCAGLYFGVLSAYGYLGGRYRWRQRLPEVRWMLGLGLLLLWLVDGWGNTLHLWATPGWLRTLSGLGVGIWLPLLLIPLANGAPSTPAGASRPPLSHPSELLVSVCSGLALWWLLIQPPSAVVVRGLAVAAAAGLVLLLSTVCLTMCRGWGRVRPASVAEIGV